MNAMSISEQVSARVFPPFSLTRLLKTTFEPKPGQKICILIDLENPRDIVNFKFLTESRSLDPAKCDHVIFTRDSRMGR